MQSSAMKDCQIALLLTCSNNLETIADSFDVVHESMQHQTSTNGENYVLGQIGDHKVMVAVLPVANHDRIGDSAELVRMLGIFSGLKLGLFLDAPDCAPNVQSDIDIRLGDIVVGKAPQKYDGDVTAFSRLFIRGVCDYSDFRAAAAWEKHTTLKLIGFTKRLLNQISPQRVTQGNPASFLFDIISKHLQRRERWDIVQQAYQFPRNAYQETLNMRGQDDQLQACRRIFKTNDYESLKDFNPAAARGTCRWIFDDPQYRSWLASSKEALLWISGSPGSGKSVLAKSLVDSFLTNDSFMESTTVCYFFIRDNGFQNNLQVVLCAILHQLFVQRPHLLQFAQPVFGTYVNKLQRNTSQLCQLFLRVVKQVDCPPIICILDGLDECRTDDQAPLIDLIRKSFNSTITSSSGGSTVKWLISSRPSQIIRDNLRTISHVCPIFHLESEHMQDVMKAETKMIIQELMRDMASEFDLSQTVVREITQSLSAMEQCPYLLLCLAADAIKRKLIEGSRSARDLAQVIPSSIETAYEEIFATVSRTQEPYLKAILTTIVGARRPLTIEELSLAQSTTMLAKSPSSIRDLTIDAKELGDSIKRWCGRLVVNLNGRLYFSHQTVKEFLISSSPNDSIARSGSWRHCLAFSGVEKQLAMICVQYLCLSEFNHEQQESDSIQDEISDIATETFFNFTAEYWASYVRNTEEILDEGAQRMVKALYDTTSIRYTRWTNIMWETTEHWYSTFGMNNIQLAALNGHNMLLQDLLRLSPDEVNSQDRIGSTALMWASIQGHFMAVQTLLRQGADVNVRGGSFDSVSNALYGASSNGHLEVVRALIDGGAEVNAQGGSYMNYSSALRAAADGGFLQVVHLLLDRGASINNRVRFFGSALEAASSKGHVDVVIALLDRGADVNTRDPTCDDDRRALYAAAENGHLETVQVLIDRGAEVNGNAANDFLGFAIVTAAQAGYAAVVELLLDRGAVVARHNARSPSLILQLAASRGHMKVVEILLSGGIDVDIQHHHYGNALSQASAGGHRLIVKMLLEEGADVNGEGGHHGCALQAAAGSNHIDIVQNLLEKGANVNVQGGYLGSPLQAAAFSGRYEIVQLLLDNGAEATLQGGKYGTALQGAATSGHARIVQLLLERGAEVNASGGRYKTAVHAAAIKGHDNVVRVLLDGGANIADAEFGPSEVPFYRPS